MCTTCLLTSLVGGIIDTNVLNRDDSWVLLEVLSEDLLVVNSGLCIEYGGNRTSAKWPASQRARWHLSLPAPQDERGPHFRLLSTPRRPSTHHQKPERFATVVETLCWISMEIGKSVEVEKQEVNLMRSIRSTPVFPPARWCAGISRRVEV